MYSRIFIEQLKLLLQCMPAIREQSYFALKGGTAINLFLQNLPRLSIDIDLAYLHLEDRESSLAHIQEGLRHIAASLKKFNPAFNIKEQNSKQDNCLLKLFVYHHDAMIKIEPNFILRGTLYPVEQGNFCQKVNDSFGVFLDKIPLLSSSEIYAGKLCAALSRQHPRDLFDVKLLLENEGITPKIQSAFIIYLASNPRPMHELLSPHLLNIQEVFEREFLNMTDYSVRLEELLLARETLIQKINQLLTEKERHFLLSIKKGEPQYDLMPFTHLHQLPALQWKLLNINRMDTKKRQQMEDKLKAVLRF